MPIIFVENMIYFGGKWQKITLRRKVTLRLRKLTQTMIDLPILMLSSFVKDIINIAFMYYWTSRYFVDLLIFSFLLHYSLFSFEQLWICTCYLNGEFFMRCMFVIYILFIYFHVIHVLLFRKNCFVAIKVL